ncbi:uncharacterized protein LOC113236849 isoform X2 [Hyposmocoma kahamanoa]|uniref:uncharacterized protein LOC113236849 isoform X2 n=1 Tax=Hyposmocoma kahamanoa TaxID=1477025 RepID=UPI000E6D5E4F|nr:uncharacterized protein LOC113236849 isoform X2 [Hyposmocoma kahamanoa]
MLISTVFLLCMVIIVVYCSNGTDITIMPAEFKTDEPKIASDNFLAKINQVYVKANKSIILKRRTVLIVGIEEPTSSLRAKPMKKKEKHTINSLLYQEYNDKNELLNSFLMRNLKDVSIFFKEFLETDICYGECEASDDVVTARHAG